MHVLMYDITRYTQAHYASRGFRGACMCTDMGFARESRVRPPDAYGADKFFTNQPVARIACSY